GDPVVDQDVDRMVAAFRRRRDYLVARFGDQLPGVEFVEPHGAFYLFFRVDGRGSSAPQGGMEFCQKLMSSEGVALVPGGAFGDDRWVRLSYSVSDTELEAATDRLVRFFSTVGGAG